MRRMATAWLCALLVLATGCVRRELEILSRPPGATVTFDGRVLEERTPIRFPFTWYGTHEVVLVKEGYHRERLVAHIKPPWYERFPLDFFAENVWPWRIDEIHSYPLVLVKERPLGELSDAEKTAIKHGLLERADRFRSMARDRVGAPPPPPRAPLPEKSEAEKKK